MPKLHGPRKLAVLLTLVALVAAIAFWGPARLPGNKAPERATPAAVRTRLADFGKVDALDYLAGAGLYRARIGGRVVYITADGRHMIAGDLYDLETGRDLTLASNAKARRAIIATLNPANAITFKPKGQVRSVVWVFTDVTCPYCRKLHRQIHTINKRGIEVRYLAYPRGGPGSRSWRLAEAVWCAHDRKATLTRAMDGAQPTAVAGCDNNALIDKQYHAGIDAGLQGTPMIVSADGRELGGYLSPQQLAMRLAATQ